MTNDDYINSLMNPNLCFRQAFSQKMIADKILHEIILNKDFLQLMQQSHDFSDFANLWGNALYHYGIGIENGFKALITKKHPELINFEIKGNDVVLHDIGGRSSKNHDLYSLANRAGFLSNKESQFKTCFGRRLVKNVLLHLTDNIRWGARYPVPTIKSKIFHMDNDIPHVCVYGFHILDVIEPIYEYFKNEQKDNQ